MSDDDDDKLRRAFASLRERDARRAPPFDALAKKGPPRRATSPWAIAAAAAPALAAAAVLVMWCGTARMSANAPTAAAPPAAQAPAAAAEHADDAPVAAARAAADAKPAPAPDPAPLDFLLDLPGSSALAAASDLGEGSRKGWSR